MSARVFVDRTGVRWTVSEVVAPTPTTERRERRAHARSGNRIAHKTKPLSTRPLALATLRFECTAERRRLTPAPAGWHALPAEELEDLLHLTMFEPAG